MAYRVETIDLMEPMLPEESDRVLADLAVDLVEQVASLNALIKPNLTHSIGQLVRSMNCYYSNLIEDHNTHPQDIERALAEDFSTEPHKRVLQLEAKAHIEVQAMIDAHQAPPVGIASAAYLRWIHQAFCHRLPPELLRVVNPQTGETLTIVPGEFRDRGVKVGQHIPVQATKILTFLTRFEQVYTPSNLAKYRQVIAVAAAHHRLLWIHPFFDGNGRVARLFAHAYLTHIGIGSSLWSVSRGLARQSQRYKQLLMGADQQRWNDLDGRGNLSARALRDFCQFFLETCIDQVSYMRALLAPDTLLYRIRQYTNEAEQQGKLPARSFLLLREALLMDTFERGQAAQITGYQERQARTVLKQLLNAGLLRSDTPKGPVHLAFNATVAQLWFPNLYPTLPQEQP
jgi:Fic family protein